MSVLHGLPARSSPPPPLDIPPQVPAHDYYDYPQLNLRYRASVRHEQAPNPYPASTAFAGVGRTPGQDATRVDRFQVLAFSEWLGVVHWPWPEHIRELRSLEPLIMPLGGQNPAQMWPEITMGTQTTHGAQTGAQAQATSTMELTPIGSSDPLAKLR